MGNTCSSTATTTITDPADVKPKLATTAAPEAIGSTPSAATEDKFAALWPAYEEKMKAEGLSAAAIAAFKYNFSVLTSGKDLMIPESTIKPVDSLPDYDALSKEDPALLKATVMVKLNG